MDPSSIVVDGWVRQAVGPTVRILPTQCAVCVLDALCLQGHWLLSRFLHQRSAACICSLHVTSKVWGRSGNWNADITLPHKHGVQPRFGHAMSS